MISVDSRQFRQAAALAAQCIEKRNTIPVLECMRVRANGKMELSGTDLDMQVDVALPCETAGKKNVDFLLGDNRFVLKALGAAGGKDVVLTPSDTALAISAGALAIDLKPESKIEDWPSIASPQEDFSARLSADHVRQLERVTAAMSDEETRYYLNGVYLHHEKDWTWRAVTTDGHRLMIAELSLPDAVGVLPAVSGAKDWSKGCIIPRKAIMVALAALRKCDDGIALRAGGMAASNAVDTTAPPSGGLPMVSFEGGLGELQYRLTTKCIDGTYPEYKRVVPSEHAFGVALPIARLRQAIDAVSWSSGCKRPAIRIAFFKDEIELSCAVGLDKGTARYRVAADHDAPKDFTIGFNGQYLRDCLGALRGETVFIGMTDSAGPAAVRDPEDTAFLSVLMPMRI